MHDQYNGGLTLIGLKFGLEVMHRELSLVVWILNVGLTGVLIAWTEIN